MGNPKNQLQIWETLNGPNGDRGDVLQKLPSEWTL